MQSNQSDSVLQSCKEGIAAWQNAFNNQDAAGCAACYSNQCVMEARPFGTFEGKAAILTFWQGIIDQGFKDVEYTDVEWTKNGDNGYILTSKWSMNKAFGVVHNEHWNIEEDGIARLIKDDFEILGEK